MANKTFPDTRFPAKQNYQDSARATATAKNVQSFDEITIMSEEPAVAAPWVPRGDPKKGYSEDPTAAEQDAANAAPPKLVIQLDDATNIRADNQILTRETPQTPNVKQDDRPDFKRRTYTDDQT